MAAVAANPAPAAEHKVKPAKPDEGAFKKDLAQAEKEHFAVQEKLNQVKAKIESARPNNQDSPSAKRQQELLAELQSIRQKQQGFKTSRSTTQEKINALDSTLKARLTEQNNSRGRMPFKNVDDIDREISRLEKEVDSGTMRLVDERKALSDISNMRKQRKNFAGLDEAQKVINDLKAQIAALRKTLDTPEAKALSDRYTEIQKELDGIKAEKDGVFKNLNSLKAERTKLQTEQREKWSGIKQIKDKYYQGRRAYKEYEDEAWRVRREKAKAQRDAIEHEKKRKVADRKLEEASNPAYADEIFSAQGLIRHFNPSYDFAALGLDDKKDQGTDYRAQVGRTVDDSDMKGVKIVKKEDRGDDYFVGTGGKKGKKGKKGGSANAASGASADNKFNMNIGIIEEFAKIKVDPPMNQADVPAVTEKLAAKITEWKKNQASKTEENIAKAKEEIARLEKESNEGERTSDVAKKPAQEHVGTNGQASAESELQQEKDASADVAEDLKKASIEEST